MKKDKAHFIAFVGLMFALIIVLFMLEGTFTFFVGATPCILSLPVAVALCVYDDWKKSFIGGTLLGVSSCIFSLAFPGYIMYANPLISILPRVFIGVTAYWTCLGLTKLCKKSKNKFIKDVLPVSVGGIIGAITNTGLYLLATFIWRDWLSAGMGEAATQMLWWVPVLYFGIEVAACAVLVPVYVKVLRKVGRKCFDGVTVYDKQKTTQTAEKEENNSSENAN